MEREAIRKRQWKKDNKGYVNHINKLREANKKQRTPSWANIDAIREIYEECSELIEEYGPRSYHVDHIIPLQGKTVSGLHVENNLQILKASDNIKKSNNYEQ
jgi:5-methylcytosine-specific restriction endonuclease McrA